MLDPFVGGGTSIVEAIRLGATTHAVDVDPVACAVSSFEARATELPDLSAPLEELCRTVGTKVRRYHITTSPDGVQRVVLHHFWVQVVRCNRCGRSYDAHPNFALGENGKDRWVICSQCGELHQRHIRHKRFRCAACGARTRIAEGNVTHGTASCPFCQERQPLITVGRTSGKPPVWRLFALEVLEEPDGGRPVPIARRRFVKASEEDVALFEAAATELRKRINGQPKSLPLGSVITQDRADSRLLDYGYRCWTDLFNARQLLHLAVLAEAIAEYEGAVREGLAIAFSSHLTTNCMMASYAGKWRRLTPLFSIRAFRHIQRPVELNPWCNGTGRGTFPNTIRKLMGASRFASSPKEPIVGGGFRHVVRREPLECPNVVCGTARNLDFLPDSTVDMVLTDPPYFDNIQYSELAEFFMPWLELLQVVGGAQTRRRVTMESLIADRHDAASIERYTRGLSSAFGEIGRVLKTDGMLMFSFRHTSGHAWNALAQGLRSSGLRVVSILPVPGEAGVGLHARTGTALWDAVFVLRKAERASFPQSLELSKVEVEEVQQGVAAWTKDLSEASIPFTQEDQLTLFRASLVSRALGDQSIVHAATSTPLSDALLRPARV